MGNRFGNDVFVQKGFRNWKNATDKFSDHVGASGSVHNNARTSFFSFKDQRQSLTRKVSSGKQVMGATYRTRLTASVDVVRFLLGQGLAFRGNDESPSSLNRGNFLELLHWYSSRNLEVEKVVKDNVSGNHQLTSSLIQKEIIRLVHRRQ